MTAARNPMSSPLPATQNTAPVIEYSCLYTHDLIRKAKRWQDGFMRYHTFNRRVMVYDTARNFIGDTFHASQQDPEDGDELDLEKTFARVQVAQRICVTQTDLTALNESRHKGQQRQTVKNTPIRNAPGVAALAARQRPSPAPAAGKHRPLGALLGTPRGPLGKAVVPVTSPFEERQKERQRTHMITPERPAKKQRLVSASSASRPRSGTNGEQMASPVRRRQVVDLCSDDSPQDMLSIPSRNANATASPRDRHQHREQPARAAVGSVPVAAPLESDSRTLGDRQPLRIISNAPRKMLLCQQQPPTRKKSDTSLARSELVQARDATARQQAEKPILDPQGQRLQERLAKIEQKQAQRAAMLQQEAAKQAHSEAQPIQSISSKHFAGSQITNERGQPPHVEHSDTGVLVTFNKSARHAVTTAGPAVKPTRPVPAAPAPSVTPASAVIGKCAASIEQHPPTPAIPPTTRVVQLSATTARAKTAPQPRLATRPTVQPAMAPPPPPPKPADPFDFGPWSREALDLFDWWPPNRPQPQPRPDAITK